MSMECSLMFSSLSAYTCMSKEVCKKKDSIMVMFDANEILLLGNTVWQHSASRETLMTEFSISSVLTTRKNSYFLFDEI